MTEPKRRVNAKQFIKDYQSGMNADELKEIHGLNDRDFKRLLKTLVERKLLNAQDIRKLLAGRIRSDQEYTGTMDLLATQKVAAPKGDPDRCPQCGARVSERALTCPECGHMLPGEKRWEDVGRKKGALDRLPPWLLGCIIAFPIAVLGYYVIDDIIFPMTEATVEKQIQEKKRREDAKKAKTGLERKRAAQQQLDKHISNLIDRNVLTDADLSSGILTAGSDWPATQESRARRLLEEIRNMMAEAGRPENFEVVDLWETSLAKVSPEQIDLGPFDSPEPQPQPPVNEPNNKAPVQGPEPK